MSSFPSQGDVRFYDVVVPAGFPAGEYLHVNCEGTLYMVPVPAELPPNRTIRIHGRAPPPSSYSSFTSSTISTENNQRSWSESIGNSLNGVVGAIDRATEPTPNTSTYVQPQPAIYCHSTQPLPPSSQAYNSAAYYPPTNSSAQMNSNPTISSYTPTVQQNQYTESKKKRSFFEKIADAINGGINAIDRATDMSEIGQRRPSRSANTTVPVVSAPMLVVPAAVHEPTYEPAVAVMVPPEGK